MEKIKVPKSSGEAFVMRQQGMKQRFSEKDIGMGVGNAITNATNLVIAMIDKAPQLALTPDDVAELIKEWTDRIYKIAQNKKEFESIPIVEDKTEPEAFQSKVDEIPPEDEVNREIGNTLTTEPEI